jgi:CBS domain-containing protein
MPSVQDVLASKPAKVHSTTPGATALQAINKMNEHGIGALVVTNDEGHVVGMFTERDVLRRVVAHERTPGEILVGEVMTTEVVCCGPREDLDEVRAVMRNRRIRHLPVCDGDANLLGLISIGDLNAHDASNQEATIHFLNDYIYGRA